MWMEKGKKWNDKEKKPLGQYLLLIFSFAWVSEAILIGGEQTGILVGTVGVAVTFVIIVLGAGFAQMYTIFILLKKHRKINGLKEYFGRVFYLGNVPRTLIITAVFCLTQFVPNIAGNSYLGNPWYLFILYIPLMIVGGGLEEVGWNGFFQPVLEERITFVPAAAISGAVWAFWHIPLWFVQNGNQSSMNFVSFFCHCIVLSFVIAVLYKLTYSVFACVLLHAWTNVLGGMYTRDALEKPVDFKLLVVYGIEIIVSIIIFWVADKKEKICEPTIIKGERKYEQN